MPTSTSNLLKAMDKRAADTLREYDKQHTLAIGSIKAITLSGAAVQMEASGRFLRNVESIQGVELVIDARVILARIGRQKWVIIGAIERAGAITATTKNTIVVPKPQNLTAISAPGHCRLLWTASYQDIRAWEIQINTTESETGAISLLTDNTQYLYYPDVLDTYYFRVRGVGPSWTRGSWTDWESAEAEDISYLTNPMTEDLDMAGYAILDILFAQFDVTPGAISEVAGRVYWQEGEYTVSVVSGLGPVLQVGQETFLPVYNDTGADIVNGQVVAWGGTIDSDLISVIKADASTFEDVQAGIGMATMLIPDTSIGLVTRAGYVRGLDTSLTPAGTLVYVPTTPSVLYDVARPTFPNYPLQVGAVLISDASAGRILVSVEGTVGDTVHNFFNGVFRESFDFTVASAGGTITGSLAPADTNDDLTMIFSTGFALLTTTPAATIVLTAGTDANPQGNFVYVPETTKVLTVSTSDWPTTEHIKVAFVVLRSAATTATDDALGNQNWNDHIQGVDNQGHMSHISAAIREKTTATWVSGIEGSLTIDTGSTPDDVWIATTAGIAQQLHRQIFVALDMETGDDIHIVNHNTTPYISYSNLGGLTVDATGSSLNNFSFSWVVWGIQNKTGETSHLMLNLPLGGYTHNAPEDALADASNYAVYDIPSLFRGTGFLIARFVMRYKNNDWILYSTVDLRGTIPNAIAGGGGGGGGASSFTALDDTPSAYTGLALQLMQVNAGETALEATGTKTENTFYAGPTAAPAAVPAFRAIMDADIETISGLVWTQPHTFDAGLVIGTTGDITMPDGGEIGIGSGDERIVFDTTGYVNVMGADVGIGIATPNCKLTIYEGAGGTVPTFSMQDGGVTMPDFSGFPLTPAFDVHEIARFANVASTFGGLQFIGRTSNVATANALFFSAYFGASSPTATSAAIVMRSAKHNGATSVVALAATETVFQIRNWSSNLLTILGGGKTGIGINVPESRLEIQTTSGEGNQAVTIDQNDADKAFIDYQGTSQANANYNISTWTTGNSIQGFVLVEINGVERWMPYYNAPTS